MPSAGADQAQVARFREDLTRLLPDRDGRLGIALSGGPDSCALLLLAAAAYHGRVAALTVDHGLRMAAASEAQDAGEICATYDIPHRITAVTVGAGSVQAAARAARYAALGDWAAGEGLSAVATAHHADDQAETMLMRLARGSGLAGLSGIRERRPLCDDIALVRPLLGWRKAELEAIVTAAGIVPARDPSNTDPRYDRTNARRLLAAADWIDPARLCASADHLREADAALAWVVDDLWLALDPDDPRVPTNLPHEIVRRLFVKTLAERFSARPDGPAVDRALRSTQAGKTTTLADILCTREATHWTFRPAPPRRSS